MEMLTFKQMLHLGEFDIGKQTETSNSTKYFRLVDLMKKNPGVGAACGRIHPTGSGYMPAYQKFEYAIGHWLQKATEHVLGNHVFKDFLKWPFLHDLCMSFYFY